MFTNNIIIINISTCYCIASDIKFISWLIKQQYLLVLISLWVSPKFRIFASFLHFFSLIRLCILLCMNFIILDHWIGALITGVHQSILAALFVSLFTLSSITPIWLIGHPPNLVSIWVHSRFWSSFSVSHKDLITYGQC